MSAAAKQLSGLAPHAASPTTAAVRRWNLPAPWQREFVHVYRKLLREATYLPDAQCRAHFRSRIVARFQAWHPRKPCRLESGRTLYRPTARHVESEERAVRLHKKACQTLRLLAAANNGALRPLKRVMALAYGRVGSRRHQLLDPYLAADPPKDDSDLRRLVEARRAGGEERKEGAVDTKPEFSSIISALAKAQVKQGQALESENVIKRFPPQVEVVNDLGLPLPEVRIKNRVKRARARVIERVLPPLPESLWLRLRDLVTGAAVWSDSVERRPRTTGSSESDRIQPAFSDLTPKMKFHHRPHNITPRFMQRRYGEILAQTPMLLQDPETRQHSVTWHRPRPRTGSIAHDASALDYFPPSPQAAAG